MGEDAESLHSIREHSQAFASSRKNLQVSWGSMRQAKARCVHGSWGKARCVAAGSAARTVLRASLRLYLAWLGGPSTKNQVNGPGTKHPELPSSEKLCQRTETLESPDPSLEPPHSSLITCPDRGGSFTDWASWPVHRYSEYVARAYPADPTMEDKAPPWFSAPV